MTIVDRLINIWKNDSSEKVRKYKENLAKMHGYVVVLTLEKHAAAMKANQEEIASKERAILDGLLRTPGHDYLSEFYDVHYRREHKTTPEEARKAVIGNLKTALLNNNGNWGDAAARVIETFIEKDENLVNEFTMAERMILRSRYQYQLGKYLSL